MTTRVLIVDNNLIDLEALKEALGEAGLEPVIEVAMDAPEAIAHIDALSDGALPDLILVDLRLFVGSGLEVVEHVRHHPRLRDTPIVVISSVLGPREREACLAAGANRADAKPRRFAEQVALAREWRHLLRSAEGGAPATIPSTPTSNAGDGPEPSTLRENR
jgi:CheY-like chemotaxis protein